MSLLKLPIEIISLICERLHIDHLFSFGQTCHNLRYILRNETICRKALQVSLRPSLLADGLADGVSTDAKVLSRGRRGADFPRLREGPQEAGQKAECGSGCRALLGRGGGHGLDLRLHQWSPLLYR